MKIYSLGTLMSELLQINYVKMQEIKQYTLLFPVPRPGNYLSVEEKRAVSTTYIGPCYVYPNIPSTCILKKEFYIHEVLNKVYLKKISRMSVTFRDKSNNGN